jgi:hypothetical protein
MFGGGITIIGVLFWEAIKFFRSFHKPLEDNSFLLVEKDVDLKPFHRMNSLFDGMPAQGGHEWGELSVEHLVNVFIDAIGVAQRVHGDTKEGLLMVAANKCQNLSFQVGEEVKNPVYKDVDMSHFIDKPMEVASRLRVMAFNET